MNVLKIDPALKDILKDEVIVVTGASSGLGKAISLGLIFAGAKVGLLDISDNVNNFSKELNKEEEVSFPVVASVTNKEELKKAYSSIKEKFGEINGLINCAGIARLGNISELEEKDILLSNNININGYFLSTNVASNFLSEGSSIINISSASARSQSKNSSLYSVAKEAQCAMTRSWALDLGEKNIRVNSVLAGDLFGDEEKNITSGIWNKEYFEKKAIEKELIKKDDPRLNESSLNKEIRKLVINYYVNRTALKKEVTYKDVAQLVIFLSSSLSSKISGESIAITSANPNSFSK